MGTILVIVIIWTLYGLAGLFGIQKIPSKSGICGADTQKEKEGHDVCRVPLFETGNRFEDAQQPRA